MSHKNNSSWGHAFWIVMTLLVFLLLLSVASCAHTNCNKPELSAELGGVVLECGNTRSSEGNRYRSCLVMKANGQTVNVVYRGCPVKQ